MFKIDVDNVVEVQVKFTLKSGKVNKSFGATLTARRLTKEEQDALPSDLLMKDFLLDNVTDWKDQRLVLDETGQPAPFSREAFDAFLSVPGVLDVTVEAYRRETRGKEKN